MKKPPGSIRIKLAKRISEFLKVPVDPWDIGQQKAPYNRPEWDCCSWWIDVKVQGEAAGFYVYSWDTMTDCARLPYVHFSPDSDQGFGSRRYNMIVGSKK